MNKLAVAAVLLLASTSVALAQDATTTTTTVTTTTCTGAVCTTSTSAAPAGTAAPATAGPSSTAAAPAGPPQNHDWKDVNNINGQLVKVGETNEYLKSFKRWNVSANPIGMILGYYGASVSYGISDNIAIRGDINFIDELGSDNTGFEIGVGAPIYFKRTYQGLFLEPGFISRTYTSGYCDFDCSESGSSDSTTTTFGPQMLVGWHWSWDSGLNFALAAGAGRDWSSKDSTYDPGVFANGYMRFGYEF